MKHDPILAADQHEEQFAADELAKATNRGELLSAWYAHAEHFTGPARERLQDVYSERLRSMGALAP